MVDTIKYSRGLNPNIKTLTLLIIGFLIVDILGAGAGLAFIFGGIVWIIGNSPEMAVYYNDFVYYVEDKVSPITTTEVWKIVRPVLYILFVIGVCFLAILV